MTSAHTPPRCTVSTTGYATISPDGRRATCCEAPRVASSHQRQSFRSAAKSDAGVCHAACALTSINGLISIATGFDVSNALTATVCFVVVLYGGYYLLTYQTSKAMVLRPAMR